MKQLAESTAKQEAQRKENIKKREDDFQKNATPEDRAFDKAWQEQMKPLTAKAFAPLVNPCQPLEPIFPSFPVP